MDRSKAFLTSAKGIKFAACVLEEHVLVEVHVRKEGKTSGGLIIPGESEERPDSLSRLATVLGVGQGPLIPATGGRAEIDLKPGDTVYIKRNRGNIVPLPGTGQGVERTIMAVSCHDILVVLRDFNNVQDSWNPNAETVEAAMKS